MYQRVESLCSTQNRASGPGIDADIFFSDPVLQEDCLEYLTLIPRKEYSRNVSELLDRLGYSYDMMKHRQQSFDENDTLDNHQENRACKTVTSGGKGEGTALYYESDIDIMHIVKDVICADYPQHFIHKENITLFHTERHETSPGYTRLKLLRFEGKHCVNEIRESLFQLETGSLYLSSQFLTEVIKTDTIKNHRLGQEITIGDTSGPSTPSSNKFNNIDNVACFSCFCPNILQCWVSRPRYHGWPSPDTIHEISLLDGHVVAVGLKGSENMYKEWRICYSLAELHLVRHFNETQLKVYILLKKMCRSVLNPVCEEMTSYIMKNLVFWMSEANGVDRFTQNLLMDRLFDCIKYLRTCVSENNLPSYMVPDRNLLSGRLDIQQRQQLTSLLSDLLLEEGRMLMRCDKLRDAMLVMYKTPDMFREFGEKRDKVESLMLMTWSLLTDVHRPGMSTEETSRLQAQNNEQLRDIDSHICHLVQLDTQAMGQMGISADEITDLLGARLSHLLS